MRTIGVFVFLIIAFMQFQVYADEQHGFDILNESESSHTYSIVHLSDTQNLATKYPGTYNYTFQYLQSNKEKYNISAIIITGDLVNTYDSKKEWEAYANAINKTSIPIYVTAGNHDTNYGKDDRYYSTYTGNTDRYSITSINDFNLVTIPYVKKSIPSNDFMNIKNALNKSPHLMTIIATHYYMDKDGILSQLGKDIGEKIVQGPTIIMAGHKSVHFIKNNTNDSFPVIQEITDFQNGVNGPTGKDYSAGTLYTIQSRNGTISHVSARTITIYPEQNLGPDQIIYSSDMSQIKPGTNFFNESSDYPKTENIFDSLFNRIQD